MGICGFGNGEAQWYRRENRVVRDGKLIATAKAEPYAGNTFTSAKVCSTLSCVCVCVCVVLISIDHANRLTDESTSVVAGENVDRSLFRTPQGVRGEDLQKGRDSGCKALKGNTLASLD